MSTNKEQKKIGSGGNGISKKAKKEKEKKAIEDSTFGLKNKNKSKKVQQFITRVEKSVKHSGDGLERVYCSLLCVGLSLSSTLNVIFVNSFCNLLYFM